MRPEFERGAGSGQRHGGPIAAIVDTVGDYALVMSLGRGVPTVNFRIDYLRPAIDTALVATARVRRAGKSIGVVDIDVHDASTLLRSVARPTRPRRIRSGWGVTIGSRGGGNSESNGLRNTIMNDVDRISRRTFGAGILAAGMFGRSAESVAQQNQQRGGTLVATWGGEPQACYNLSGGGD